MIPRGVRATLLLGFTFFAYLWIAKETPALYVHEPWQDDPYDAVVSFSLLVLPLLTVLVALRAAVCIGAAEVPLRRAVDLLRGSRLIVGIVAVTALSNWISLALRVHLKSWNGTTTAVFTLLAAFTAWTGLLLLQLHRNSSARPAPATESPDWAADGILLLERIAGSMGPTKATALRLIRRLDRAVIAPVRSHPVTAAAVFSFAAAVAADLPQVVIERYSVGVAIFFVTVSACSMFAFLTVGGRYLRLVGAHQGPVSPGVPTLVAAAASVPLAVTFRGALLWIIGTSDAHAGPEQLTQLLLLCAGATAVIGGLVEWLSSRRGVAVLKPR